jgi:hypothetical protein
MLEDGKASFLETSRAATEEHIYEYIRKYVNFRERERE